MANESQNYSNRINIDLNFPDEFKSCFLVFKVNKQGNERTGSKNNLASAIYNTARACVKRFLGNVNHSVGIAC